MKISIIVPAFNAQHTLPELLESILIQTYKNFELIIVDDASTDATATVANSARASVFLCGKSGPAYCRNLGAEMLPATHCIYDSDSKLSPDGSSNGTAFQVQ
jgi:glycosyltransferase involved in cell wall biosynthesis